MLVLCIRVLILLSIISVNGSLYPVESDSQTSISSEPEQDVTAIITERDEMFMLATLAYAFNIVKSYPKPGYTIAALIAWDVEDVAHTPEFVMERNRNFEMQGEIFHAEINTLRKAILKKQDFSVAPSVNPKDLYLDYTYRLANTTLYTSLEPCPMCAMTLLVARVPRVIYFMEDPGIRDSKTHELIIPLPTQAYRRKVSTSLSKLPLARAVQDDMSSYAAQHHDGPSIKRLSNGQEIIRVLDYIDDHATDIFGTAYKQLFTYSVQHQENRQLLDHLKKAIGNKY